MHISFDGFKFDDTYTLKSWNQNGWNRFSISQKSHVISCYYDFNLGKEFANLNVILIIVRSKNKYQKSICLKWLRNLSLEPKERTALFEVFVLSKEV